MSTAVQLTLFSVTPPAQHAAQGPHGGSLPELRQQRQGGPPESKAPKAAATSKRCLLASQSAPQAVVECRPMECPYWLQECF